MFSFVVPRPFLSLRKYWDVNLQMLSTILLHDPFVPSLSRLRQIQREIVSKSMEIPEPRQISQKSVRSFDTVMDELVPPLRSQTSLMLWKYGDNNSSTVLFASLVTSAQEIVLYLPETYQRHPMLVVVETENEFEQVVKAFFPLDDDQAMSNSLSICTYHLFEAEQAQQLRDSLSLTPSTKAGTKRPRNKVVESTPQKKLQKIAPKPTSEATTPSGQLPLPPPMAAPGCEICGTTTNLTSLPCNHAFCKSCSIYLNNECAASNCTGQVPETIKIASVGSSPATSHSCPECSSVLNLSATPDYLFNCGKCQKEFCLACKLVAHYGSTCDEAANGL